MSKLRVLQVFTIMDRGGAESMIMNYYRQINKDLIQFDFLVHRPHRGVFDDEIESLGGKIYRLSPINPFSPEKYYGELRHLLLQHLNDYKIIHSHLNTFSFFPLKIAEELNIPVRIAHAHIAMDPPRITDLFPKVNIKDYLKKHVKYFLKNRITEHSTHYFSCGVKAGNWLFGQEIEFRLMNNAINTATFKYNSSLAIDYKKELNLSDDFVIGHIGRFTSQKNHIFLINIFHELLKINPCSKLLLIGDGPLRPSVENYVNKLSLKDNVLFLGVRKDVPNLCMAMDFFVFPSLYEGLPVTLIETQCSGLRIMSSDQITREVALTDNIYFESIDTPASIWAENILSLAKYKREDLIGEIIAQNYDIEENTFSIEKFYLESI